MSSAPEARPEGRSGGLRVSGADTSARSQSVWMSAARVFAGLLTIGIPLVLVRVLAQSEFGHYKQIFLIALTGQTLLALGVPGSLYYFVPRDREAGHRYQTQSLWLLVLLGLLAAGLVLIAGSGIERLFHAELGRYLPLLALFVALAIPASLIPVAPMVDRRSRLAATLVVTLDLVRAGLLIGVALVTRSLFWIVVAACVAMALQLGTAVGYLLRSGGSATWRPDPARIKEQLAYVLPFSGASTIGFARQKIHAYYVGAAFSAAEFAVYAAATINIPLISQFSQTIEEVVVLENAAHHSGGRTAEMRRVWHRASHLLGLVMIPVWLIAETFAPEMIRLLYGAPYAGATPIFRIFLCMLPLSVFLGSPMLRAAGDTRRMIVADLIALVVAVGVLVAFAGPFGPLAAVASLVCGKAAYMFAAAGRTARRLGLGVTDLLHWRALSGITALAAISAFAVAGLADLIGVPWVAKLFAGGPAAGLLFLGAAWRLGLVPESEKEWARDVVGRVRVRLRALWHRIMRAEPRPRS
ncbi:MAG: lipopolysaccharide biosynthesis protein [Gemmatimonadota bacterium]